MQILDTETQVHLIKRFGLVSGFHYDYFSRPPEGKLSAGSIPVHGDNKGDMTYEEYFSVR